MKDWIRNLAALPSQGMYSQSYQDSLLVEVFKNVGTCNSPPYCVEFGFNHPDLLGGSGSNVARLLLHEGWKGLLLDAEFENLGINLQRHFLSSSNICDIFRQYGVPAQPEYVSVDVDSTDLWLFKAILQDYRPMVFTVEYNANYAIDSAITFPNDTNHFWQGDRGYGSSLKALVTVANAHGYSLLWVIPKLDAVFIRTDLIDDGSGELVYPLEHWKSCTNMYHHLPVLDATRLQSFVNYETFVQTGDLKLSQQAAQTDAIAFLTDSWDLQSIKRRGLARTFRNLYKHLHRQLKMQLRKLRPKKASA